MSGSESDDAPRATFTALENSTAADWALIGAEFHRFAEALPNRVLAHLKLLDGDFAGFPIDRLRHSLQTATMAHRDGRDEAYVVMALLHDIGDTLGCYNHPELSATMIRPFVSDELYWTCLHHGAFQGYYYFHHLGLDRDVREQYRGHEHFAACAEFCEKYDQRAFDAAYDEAPLGFFEPMVRRVFSTPLRSMFTKSDE